MRTPTRFPARAVIAAVSPQPANPAAFAFPARRNGDAVPATARTASVIWLGRPAVPCIPLALAGPAGPPISQAPGTGPGWNGPGQNISGLWLRNAAVGLCALAAAAAASDTLIGVVRARAIARRHHLTAAFADDTATPLAALGGLIMWLLRLILTPVSTLAGFRAWLLEECPVAPGRRAPSAPSLPTPPSRLVPSPYGAGVPSQTKTARFLDLVNERHGPIASLPLHAVAQIASSLAPQVDLNPGSARAALRRAVLAAQNGGK